VTPSCAAISGQPMPTDGVVDQRLQFCLGLFSRDPGALDLLEQLRRR
jgi:hypothetical protein